MFNFSGSNFKQLLFIIVFFLNKTVMLFIEFHVKELFLIAVKSLGKEFLEKSICICWLEMLFSIFNNVLCFLLARSFSFFSILSLNVLNSLRELFSICSTSLISFSFKIDCANSLRSNSTSQDFPSEIFLTENSFNKSPISLLFSMFSKTLETDWCNISSVSIITWKSESKLSSLENDLIMWWLKLSSVSIWKNE